LPSEPLGWCKLKLTCLRLSELREGRGLASLELSRLKVLKGLSCLRAEAAKLGWRKLRKASGTELKRLRLSGNLLASLNVSRSN
jgi:hypothetical protein